MRIAVVGVEPGSVDRASTSLELLGWQVVRHTMEPGSRWSAGDDAHGYCALFDGEEPPWLAELDRMRAQAAPLVVVSSTPPTATRATMWLARLPGARTLSALLSDVLGAAPRGPRRQRKSDLIVGSSPAVLDVVQRLDRVSGSRVPVLVTGESGSGKELVARALHFCGPRAAQPFVPVNCAAIPESLFEAELFGHERGAFTGALRARAGLFETANGGTLFLDEIGELPLAMQPKLLRVLESGEVTRLGGSDVRRVAVRLVAATNRNLMDEVQAGRFREDLYYRVGVYPIHLPPLRERAEDVPALVAHHVAELCAREGTTPPAVTQEALMKLLGHHWPGNVRELINVLQRALLLAGAGPIEGEHIHLPSVATPMVSSYREAKQEFEAQYYSQLMRLAGGNISLAAKLAQKTRKEIYDTLRKLGLEVNEFRCTD